MTKMNNQLPATIAEARAGEPLAASGLLECCLNIANPSLGRCSAAATWRTWFMGAPTGMVWCDEHKPKIAASKAWKEKAL